MFSKEFVKEFFVVKLQDLVQKSVFSKYVEHPL